MASTRDRSPSPTSCPHRGGKPVCACLSRARQTGAARTGRQPCLPAPLESVPHRTGHEGRRAGRSHPGGGPHSPDIRRPRPLWPALLSAFLALAFLTAEEALDIDTLEREADRETLEAGKDPSVEALFEKAEQLARSGQLGQAILTYRIFIRKHLDHPKAAEATVRIVQLERQLALKAKEAQLQKAIEALGEDPAKQLEARIALADFYVAHRCPEDARKVYEAVLAEDPVSLAGLEAPLRIAALLEAAGQAEEALKLYEDALANYPKRLEAYLEKFPEVGKDDVNRGYHANRARLGELERQQSILKKIAALYEQLGDEKGAVQARQRLLRGLPHAGTARLAFLIDAERELAGGNHAVACDLFLAALKPPRMAPARAKALVSPNTYYLSEYREPQPAEVLAQIFGGFWACGPQLAPGRYNERRLRFLFSDRYPTAVKEMAGDKPGWPETPAILARMWQIAFDHALEGRWKEAERVYEDLSKALPETLFRPLSLYWLGLAATQQGLYSRAAALFERSTAAADALQAQPCGLRTSCLFAKGEALFRWGRYDRARQVFEELLSTTALTTRLLPRTLYRLAQCHEFQGGFDAARETYEQLQGLDDVAPKLKGLATCAVARIDRHWGTVGPVSNRPAILSYLGENRGAGGDLGDWKYNYGVEAYILCAMMCPQDIVGGRGRTPEPSGQVRPRPLSYRFHTNKEGEPGRRWLTAADDRNAPGALWNPILFTHSSSNVDDFGEQLKPGEGDVVAVLSVPKGAWRLSLAFVDDANYYEGDNRVWTLYVKDKANRFLTGTEGRPVAAPFRASTGRFLAGTEVSDHLCAVYKHFAVRGPVDLEFHICRDRSLNTLLSGIFLDPLGAPVFEIPEDTPERRPSELSEEQGRNFAQLRQRAIEVNQRSTIVATKAVPSGSLRDLACPPLVATSSPACPPPEGKPASWPVPKGSGGPAATRPASSKTSPPRPGSACLPLLDEIEQLVRDLETFGDEAYSPAPRPPLYKKNPIPPQEVITARQWALEGHLALVHPRRVQAEAVGRWADTLKRKIGEQETDAQLAKLSDGLRENGPAIRAQLYDEERLRLVTGRLEPTLKILHELIEEYYPSVDRNFAREKFEHLLRAYIDGRSPQTQVDRVRALANYHRGKSRWDLVEQAFARLRANVPAEKLPDEYFRHVADAFRYQQRYEEAAEALRSLQRDFPDRVDAKRVAFELIINSCGAAKPEQALEVLQQKEAELLEDRAANARHLVASAYFHQRKAPSKAREQLEVMLKRYPKSRWTGITQKMLSGRKEE